MTPLPPAGSHDLLPSGGVRAKGWLWELQSLQSPKATVQKCPTFGTMLCCHNLEIIDNFIW